MKYDKLGPRLYLDTNIYIYGFEDMHDLQKKIHEVFRHVDENDIQIIASEIILSELFIKPIKEGRSDILELYNELLYHHKNISLVPVSHPVILQSTFYRASYGLKTIDALHMATAIEHKCSAFITQDKKLQNVKDIKVLTLNDL